VRNEIRSLFFFLIATLALPPLLPAQTPIQTPPAKAANSPSEPNLSGVWNTAPPAGAPVAAVIAYFSTFGKGEPAMTPWAEAQYKAGKPSFGPKSVTMEQTNDPVYKCYPPGAPRVYLHPFPLQIVQIPGQVIMLFEYDHTVRHIYTDGRPHPDDLTPTWMGHSIGHWEGDTLVVDTIGFNDKTWLDRIGHVHSDQLHLVERFRRVNENSLQLDLTIEDPKAFTKPINSTLSFQPKPGWDIMEHSCMDNTTFVDFEKKENPTPK
jgi:hypothetical protein